METFLFLAGTEGFHLYTFFFLDEALVYFDFEAYFHSPNAADG